MKRRTLRGLNSGFFQAGTTALENQDRADNSKTSHALQTIPRALKDPFSESVVEMYQLIEHERMARIIRLLRVGSIFLVTLPGAAAEKYYFAHFKGNENRTEISRNGTEIDSIVRIKYEGGLHSRVLNAARGCNLHRIERSEAIGAYVRNGEDRCSRTLSEHVFFDYDSRFKRGPEDATCMYDRLLNRFCHDERVDNIEVGITLGLIIGIPVLMTAFYLFFGMIVMLCLTCEDIGVIDALKSCFQMIDNTFGITQEARDKIKRKIAAEKNPFAGWDSAGYGTVTSDEESPTFNPSTDETSASEKKGREDQAMLGEGSSSSRLHFYGSTV